MPSWTKYHDETTRDGNYSLRATRSDGQRIATIYRVAESRDPVRKHFRESYAAYLLVRSTSPNVEVRYRVHGTFYNAQDAERFLNRIRNKDVAVLDSLVGTALRFADAPVTEHHASVLGE